MDWDRILLYQVSQEAYEAVQSGQAAISTGGIRRKGANSKGFLELAKPAVISAADLQSLFEGKDHAFITDERLDKLEARFSCSETAIKEIENTAWLNNAAINRTYSLTHDGFLQTLKGLEHIATKQDGFEKYTYKRDFSQLIQEMRTYMYYLKTDEGYLRSNKYDVTNGNIAEHLDQMSALINTLMEDVKMDDGDCFLAIMIIKNLLPPFADVVRKYSALYYYENGGDLMPGAYDEWVHTISMVCKSKEYREKLAYYIHLNCSMPFKDKVILSREITNRMRGLINNVVFDRQYSQNHSKEEYLSISEQLRKKIETKDYIRKNNVVSVFLGDQKQPAIIKG